MGRRHAGPRIALAVFAATVMLSMAVSVYHLLTHQAPLLPTILGQWSLLVLSIAFAGGGYYALTSVETWTERSIIGWRASIAYALGGLASGGYAYHQHVTPEVEFGLDSVVFQATFVALAAGIAGLVIGRQIVSRTRTRENLEATVAELERANERLDEFASVVSHDLRNPLHIAKGRLELVREERDGEHLDAIDAALDRMRRLIKDVLWLAREGRTIAETKPIDLQETVEAAWSMTPTDDNQVTIDLVVTDDCTGLITADKARLHQLLENLFRNAIEHGGTDVTVTVGELEDGIYVEDNGPGIPEEERDEVFDVGYSTSEEGTGFGLSIVEQIADAHGWTICVTEGSDGGIRFEVTGIEFAG